MTEKINGFFYWLSVFGLANLVLTIPGVNTIVFGLTLVCSGMVGGIIMYISYIKNKSNGGKNGR